MNVAAGSKVDEELSKRRNTLNISHVYCSPMKSKLNIRVLCIMFLDQGHVKTVSIVATSNSNHEPQPSCSSWVTKSKWTVGWKLKILAQCLYWYFHTCLSELSARLSASCKSSFSWFKREFNSSSVCWLVFVSSLSGERLARIGFQLIEFTPTRGMTKFDVRSSMASE